MKKLSAAIKRKLSVIKRHKHHEIIHRIHKSYRISHKTLFYMKEYGKKSHIASVILKESLPALIIAFVIGIAAGVSLQTIRDNFVVFLPLIILLPALNDMIGDYSMIMISRLSTLVFTKGIRRWWGSEDMHKIIRTILMVAVLSGIYIGIASSILAYLKGFPFTFSSVTKVLEVSLITTLAMVGVVIIISASCVFYVYKRREDPNNVVMPIMTSVADLGTILIFALAVRIIF